MRQRIDVFSGLVFSACGCEAGCYIARHQYGDMNTEVSHFVLQGKCQELWVLGDVISEGMGMEIETAKRRRQPVRYFSADFEEVESL